MEDTQRYLDPLTLAKVGGLELQARLVVEGYLSGMHKSPYHGFSVEFAQHREYVPGDDPKHVDWRVYFTRDKYFVKQYELETNFVCHLILDVSASMRYGEAAEQNVVGDAVGPPRPRHSRTKTGWAGRVLGQG